MIEIDAIKINDDELKQAIASAKDLNDNEAAFAELSKVSQVKKQIKDVLDTLESIEAEAKSEIDSRAKALYGSDWQAIAGRGYKISRSRTGSVYTINPEIKPLKKYLVIKETVNTKLVEAEVEVNGKLPKGIEINPSRGTMIKVTIK